METLQRSRKKARSDVRTVLLAGRDWTVTELLYELRHRGLHISGLQVSNILADLVAEGFAEVVWLRSRISWRWAGAGP